MFTVDKLPKSLSLSIEGENKIIQYAFDFSAWHDKYGEGNFFIKAQRPTEDTPYIAAAVAIDDNTHIAIWTVTYTDTGINGIGAIELNYVGDNFHKKSSIIRTIIANALLQDGEAPDAYEDWMANLVELAETTTTNANSANASANSANASANSAAESAAQAQEYRVKFTDTNGDGNITIAWGGE